MCQRLDIHNIATVESAFERFGANSVAGAVFSYNIAAGDKVSILRFGRRGIDASIARWGSIEYLRYNMGHPGTHGPLIRSEDILALPRLRHLTLTRNCVVAVNGFYAWEVNDAGRETQPFHIGPSSEHAIPLLLAGVWYPTNRAFPECSIVTTPAIGSLATISHRMPVMLDAARARLWMAGGPVNDLSEHLEPSCPELTVQRVSSKVFDTDNTGEDCLSLPSAHGRQRELLPGKYHQQGLWAATGDQPFLRAEA